MNSGVSRPPLCRWVNNVAVLNLLRQQGPQSRADIARRLGLNPASVTRIVQELLQKNLLRERPPEPQSKRGTGRPPVWLEFNSQASFVAAVDLGGTFIRAAVLDLAGNVLRRASARSEPGERSLDILMGLLEELMNPTDPLLPKPSAISVGVPGVVTFPEGTVVAAPSLGWRNLPLKRLLWERFPVPIVVENDVNLHALGEHWRGQGQGVSQLVCVFIGTGIGAGIILDGKLYRGATCSAGEVGYLIPDIRYLGQVFDGFGCLEHLASGFGIAQRGRAAVRAGNGDAISTYAGSSSPEGIEASHVLDAYREGDPTARGIVEEAQRYIALALADVACVLNPEVIVIGGGIVESGVLDLQLLRDWVAKAVPSAPKLVFSTLGSDAGLLGGVALAWESPEFLEALLDRASGPSERRQRPMPAPPLHPRKEVIAGGSQAFVHD